MDLLETLIPNPIYFHIRLSNGKQVAIKEYESIHVDFRRGGTYKKGKYFEINNPIITYRVELDDENKEKLRHLFRDCPSSAWGTIHRKLATLCLSENRYLFKATVIATPRMAMSKDLDAITEYDKNVKIELKLEHTDISLFDEVEIAYEKYEKHTRFELMDL